MEDKPLVSIIVPSFNVEPYIKKCLDSIKAQTYDNWECIIVDRASTKDSTTDTIKAYIKDDERFHFIEQVNKGVSDGRNVGFKAAKGKYIQFTDPDDWLSPELFELSVARAEETNADIVQFAWSNYFVQTGRYVETEFMPFARKFPKVFSVDDLGSEIFKYGEIHINSMSKLWRRDFLERAKLEYPVELRRAEDLAEVSRLVMTASRITYLDKVLYFYKVDEYQADSLSNFNSDDEHNVDFYKAIMIVRENMTKMKLLPKFKDSFCQIAINNSLFALNMSRVNIPVNRQIYECIRLQVLPLIVSELKKQQPETYELFNKYDYDSYLGKNIKDIYFDNQAKHEYILKLQVENAHLQDELKSYLSVKRSAKLTLGNIKRRIRKR